MVDLKTTEEAAPYLRQSERTLIYWRANGTGPRYARLGRRVVYDVADLDAFIERQKRGEAR